MEELARTAIRGHPCAELVLDATVLPPRELSRYRAFDHVSGVVLLDGDIWVAEFGGKTVQRLHPLLRAALANGGQSGATLSITGGAGRPAVEARDPTGAFDGLWIGRDHRREADLYLLVRGDRFFGRSSRARRGVGGTFALDMSRAPYAIDFTIEGCDCELEGKRALGIVEVARDRLRVASARPGDDARPGSFSTGGGAVVFDFARFDPGG